MRHLLVLALLVRLIRSAVAVHIQLLGLEPLNSIN